MEQCQVSRSSVESLGKVLLAHGIHWFCQRFCQLECKHVDKLLLGSGVWLMLITSDMFGPLLFLSIPSTTFQPLNLAIGGKLCLIRVIALLRRLMWRPP